MSVRTDIEGLAISIAGVASFTYMDVYEANANDNLQYPNVQMLEVETGSVYIHPTTGGVYDRPNVYLRFLDHHEMDQTGLQRDETVTRMKQLSRLFINAVNNSGKYEPVENVSYLVIINSYDTNVSGVEINFQLRPIEPEGFC